MDSTDLQQPPPPSAADPLTNEFVSLNDLAHELSSLHDLAVRGSWRSILDKVNRARSLSLLTKPHEHLTYLSYCILALTKLRRFNDAAAEFTTALEDEFDSPHYRYETYPQVYPNRTGSMIPFSLRWLHALLPLKLGSRLETIDRLYLLLGFVLTRIESHGSDRGVETMSTSLNVWIKREVFVVNCLVTQHLANKEFNVCLDLIKQLIAKGNKENPALLSKLGYIQMQIGDLDGAKDSFKRVEDMMKEGKSYELLSETEIKNLVNRNKALMYLVEKDYLSAVREYEECIERDYTDIVAINNKALCLMYQRNLSDSIKVLENSLERVPTVALNETLVVNLCSMYELAYVNHSDIKRTLSNWIARVAPDDFDAACTRI